MKLDDFERKLSNADNKTKEYLKMAAEAIMKEEKDWINVITYLF